jgi:hypothetical protein
MKRRRDAHSWQYWLDCVKYGGLELDFKDRTVHAGATGIGLKCGVILTVEELAAGRPRRCRALQRLGQSAHASYAAASTLSDGEWTGLPSRRAEDKLATDDSYDFLTDIRHLKQDPMILTDRGSRSILRE